MSVVVDMVHARVVRSLRQTVPQERSIRGDTHLSLTDGKSFDTHLE